MIEKQGCGPEAGTGDGSRKPPTRGSRRSANPTGSRRNRRQEATAEAAAREARSRTAPPNQDSSPARNRQALLHPDCQPPRRPTKHEKPRSRHRPKQKPITALSKPTQPHPKKGQKTKVAQRGRPPTGRQTFPHFHTPARKKPKKPKKTLDKTAQKEYH